MVSDVIKEKVVELAKAIMESEEYKNFVEKEEALRNNEEIQSMLAEFQSLQQEFITLRMSGEVNEDLISKLNQIQSALNEKVAVKEFMEAYTRFINMLGEVGDILSNELEFDFAEVYRS